MTITWSIACLPARAFPRFQWRGGAATHARSEITLGSSGRGATPAVMKGARATAGGRGRGEKEGGTAAKDALVAVAALSLGPLYTQVHRLSGSSLRHRKRGRPRQLDAAATRSRSHLTLVYHKTWCRATESTDDVNN